MGHRGETLLLGRAYLRNVAPLSLSALSLAPTRPDETAAILFTTGSTGPAKGAVYTHGNFDAQLRQIKTHLNISTDEIDPSTFPLFALFWPALGITSVIPDMDPTRPAEVNPVKIIEAVNDQGVTQMFASPALLNRVGRYGWMQGVKLPSLKRVISAGAPVSPDIIERFTALLSEKAEIHTPYGATEAVPVLSIRSLEILNETRSLSEQGFGTCIGYPINDIKVKIIRISDEPLPTGPMIWQLPTAKSVKSPFKGTWSHAVISTAPKPTPFLKSRMATASGTAWEIWADGTSRAASGFTAVRVTASSLPRKHFLRFPAGDL
jgi:acyl-coenzyme A synthetase/AMP-(fatty) acid ligase